MVITGSLKTPQQTGGVLKGEYQRLIESPEWQKTRKEIINRDESCVLCGSTENLQVHHRKYSRPFLDKFFSYNHLTTLCQDCHEFVTSQQRGLRYKERDLWPITNTPIHQVTVVREIKQERWFA